MAAGEEGDEDGAGGSVGLGFKVGVAIAATPDAISLESKLLDLPVSRAGLLAFCLTSTSLAFDAPPLSTKSRYLQN